MTSVTARPGVPSSQPAAELSPGAEQVARTIWIVAVAGIAAYALFREVQWRFHDMEWKVDRAMAWWHVPPHAAHRLASPVGGRGAGPWRPAAGRRGAARRRARR